MQTAMIDSKRRFRMALELLWFASASFGAGLLAAIVAAVVVVVLATPAYASRPMVPRLVVPGAESPIVLQKLAISAELTGSVARTTVEMVFYNPNRRQLEGELQFPLLPGQQITGFALDIDGKLRDAVVVEKTRGQQVFEDISRQRIDPGLLQATEGNNFKLRVYPIFANATRTVAVTYTESLAPRGTQGIYRLPLEYGSKVGEFSLELNVGAAVRPRVSGTAARDLVFQAGSVAGVLKVRRENYEPRGVLDIAVDRSRTTRVITQQHGGRDDYFYAEVPVTARKVKRALPTFIGLVWDSSASGAKRDHARELALLDAYFAQVRNAEVQLVRIRDVAEVGATYSVVDGQWHALRWALEETIYDGATNLNAFAPDAGVHEYLLFSDGLANYGDGVFPKIGVPLYAISSSAQANPSWLKDVAHKTGGQHLDLLADTPAAALERLTHDFERIRSITATGATQLMPTSPYPVNGTLAVAGMLTEPAAEVRVQLALPGGKLRTVTWRVEEGKGRGAFAASFWARERIARLEANPEVNRAEILRLGKAFSLVTAETSLIVLETVQDYVRFEIEPPRELMAQYETMRRQTRRVEPLTVEQKIERVVAMLAAKEAWWKGEFDKGPVPKPAAPALAPRFEFRSMPRPAPKPEAQPRVLAQRAAESSADRMQDGPATSVAVAAPKAARAWSPDAPYRARLAAAKAVYAYRIYLDERPAYAASAAFYLDVSQALLAKGERVLALRVLSNLAEIDLEDRHTLRSLGQRLTQLGEHELALGVYRKVARIGAEEPQSYRDLGLAYAAAGDAQRAVDALYEVVVRSWHPRFPEIELVALADLNAIVATAKTKPDLSRIDRRLLRHMPVDLRIVLTWDADNTNIDLQVVDPNGQTSYPGGPVTFQGGRTSHNFVQGYGPEEYAVRVAKPGTYKVVARFSNDQRQLADAAPVHAHVHVYTKFGTGEQQVKTHSVLLNRVHTGPTVAEIDVAAADDGN